MLNTGAAMTHTEKWHHRPGANKTTFGFPQVRHRLHHHPGVTAHQIAAETTLHKMQPTAQPKVLFTEEPISAQEALLHGLLSRVVPEEQLEEETMRLKEEKDRLLEPSCGVIGVFGQGRLLQASPGQRSQVAPRCGQRRASGTMSQRQVLQVFEQYQKARTQFVQMVAELATRPQNIETLQNAGVMSLLRPLLLDVVPTIQQTAALALGRLANYNDDLAEAVVKGDILPQLVYSLAEQNRFYKKAAAFVLRAVAKHSPQLAQAIVDCGALDTLVICLEDFDPGVKESAAWALGYIARHNAGYSKSVRAISYETVTSCGGCGAVPLLVLCIQEPEIALKRIAASDLSDISKHSPELAQTVVDAGAIAHLAQMILNPDAKLKRQVLSALSQIAKHSVDLAEMVVEAEIFPVVLTCLKDKDEYVKKNASTLIREIAKHTPELSQLIVNAGGVAAVIDCIGSCKGNIRLPGIMMLGYVAAHSENLAMAVIISKVLPHDSKARRLFVTSGGLKKVQEIKAEPGSLLQEYINSINNCYPEEIVRPDSSSKPTSRSVYPLVVSAYHSKRLSSLGKSLAYYALIG
ncbi:Sperm-associated antigen 6 [Myotis brandtii]|uniref:Sperm-associated antigen 6 n=1 Tax=Myotis brandtii TaxID=109478 RepID=S7NAS4_MYOBR|nr:Sperm-associated antigen 6 [Myotis brandtii]